MTPLQPGIKIGWEITIAKPKRRESDPEKASRPFEDEKSFTAPSISFFRRSSSTETTSK